MAFVTDSHDPSGLGMFSKVGRFTTEKYIIFQKKDEILYNKRKFLKVSSLPNLDLKSKNDDDEFNKENEFFEEKKDEGLEIIQEKKKPKQEIRKNEEKHRKDEFQPFYKMISREKVDRRNLERNPPPPCGYYKPKYTEIDKRPHLVWDYLKSNMKTPVKSPKNNMRSTTNSVKFESTESFLKPIAERPLSRVVGPLTLSKQTGRDNKVLQSPCNPHEERFKVLKLSETWSNLKKTPSFNIRKKLGRDDNKMYVNKEFAPDYNPNFEVGKEKIGKSVIPFKKMLERKNVPKFSSTKNENFFDWDYYTNQKNSQIYRKIYTPDFKKQLPREADNNLKLPGFMQKFLNTRMTITLLTHKMIEMNNYMDGNFQGIYSSFKSPIKKIEKEEDDSVSIDDQD